MVVEILILLVLIFGTISVLMLLLSIFKKNEDIFRNNQQLLEIVEIDRILSSFPQDVISSLYQQFLTNVMRTDSLVPTLDSTLIKTVFTLPVLPEIDGYVLTRILESLPPIKSVEVLRHEMKFNEKKSCYMYEFHCEIRLDNKDKRVEYMLNNSYHK